MAGLSTLQSGPKGSERDQNGQPKCFWPLGTLLGPSGPFWTVSNKNWYFAPKHLCQPLLCLFGAKKSFLLTRGDGPTLFFLYHLFHSKLFAVDRITKKGTLNHSERKTNTPIKNQNMTWNWTWTAEGLDLIASEHQVCVLEYNHYTLILETVLSLVWNNFPVIPVTLTILVSLVTLTT